MSDSGSSPSLPFTSEPLNFQLNFTQTDKAKAKADFTLLEQGEYRATEKRMYPVLRKCHGCGTAEKAKTIICVQEHVTGEVYEIGLQCMSDMYGVDLQSLNEHTREVASIRRQLKRALGLKGDLSTERMIQIVREALLTFVPLPGRYLAELDQFDHWSLGSREDDRIRDLHQLALYHQEWADDPDHARRRWQALRAHPAFPAARKPEVRSQCERALEAGPLLSEREVIRLNGCLREASRYKEDGKRLVAPENFNTPLQYEQALREGLEELVGLGQAVAQRLSGNGTSQAFNPLTLVGKDAKALYAVVGVWDDEATSFQERLHRTEGDWKGYRRPLITVGPQEQEYFPEREGRRINSVTNEWEEYVIEKAWTFHFRRVAWALLESYTDTHRLWAIFGRDRLERYL